MNKNKKSLWAEFREFINKGNVMDMAVGVIIGGAFKSIVDSLVSDLFMPLVSRVTGGVDFTNWFVSLDGNRYDTLAAAQEAGAATLNYGKFITVVLNFILLAFFVFLIVKAFNALRESTHKKQQEAPAAPTTKVCPYCKSTIAIDAVRCPNCTSELPLPEEDTSEKA